MCWNLDVKTAPFRLHNCPKQLGESAVLYRISATKLKSLFWRISKDFTKEFIANICQFGQRILCVIWQVYSSLCTENCISTNKIKHVPYTQNRDSLNCSCCKDTVSFNNVVQAHNKNKDGGTKILSECSCTFRCLPMELFSSQLNISQLRATRFLYKFVMLILIRSGVMNKDIRRLY